MEDTLRVGAGFIQIISEAVLILVLMEDTLRDKDILDKFSKQES